ncbi:TPA: hypothetical protein N0F65_006281 [Lagenidium giganteum]|uniref:UDENN domain-containing protein n=1 Tax=Lagenidium giganteum TaxID=4803 RepID=A0AAV2YBV7_9STRA|nr:TPA: hypothetical protein N0F65_006281 [Lagenidium giganteum]
MEQRTTEATSDGAGASRCRLVDYYVEVVAEPTDDFVLDENENFERKIVKRFPLVDHDDFPLPDGVPYFCIPDSLGFFNPSVYERKPVFFSFSLTGGDGSRAYGFALHYYEEFVTVDADWRPRVFCIVSHHPFFSLFKEIISWVYRSRTQKLDEQALQHKIADACDRRKWFLSPRNGLTPLPSSDRALPLTRTFSERGPTAPVSLGAQPLHAQNEPLTTQGQANEDRTDSIISALVNEAYAPSLGGCIELKLNSTEFFRYHVHRGKSAHLDDYCFRTLFQCLSVKNVIYVLNCMMMEQRILIHSNHHGLLTPVCEALCALMFPFCWEHVYVPFLPVKLIDYLHAPVPYIMGLHTSSLATRVGSEIFASCVVVHLDKNKVVSPIFSRVDDSPIDFSLVRFPPREVDMLLQVVSDLVPVPVSSTHTQPSPTQRRHSSTSAHSGATTPPHHSSPFGDPSQFISELQFESEVELTFGEGPLGITFESTHLRLLAVSGFESLQQHPGASAVVKAFPRLQNGLPGPAERSGRIAPGSFLIGINGQSTLDMSFEETISRLRSEPRPVCLRFLNAPHPHQNACRFAERLQSLSLISPLQMDKSNVLLPWVDTVRSAFALMFASVFRDYQKFICVQHLEVNPVSPLRRRETVSSSTSCSSFSSSSSSNSLTANPSLRRCRRTSSSFAFSVSFDHKGFCSAAPPSSRAFLHEFTQTQSFSGFVNDSVIERISHMTEHPQLELFKQCIHMVHELGNARPAIELLYERDPTPLETIVLDLPKPELNSKVSKPTVPVLSASSSSVAPTASSSAMAKRRSRTRQLEMLICGSLPEDTDDDDATDDTTRPNQPMAQLQAIPPSTHGVTEEVLGLLKAHRKLSVGEAPQRCGEPEDDTDEEEEAEVVA